MSQFNITHLQVDFQHQIIKAEKKLAATKSSSGKLIATEALADMLEQFGLHAESQIIFQQLAEESLLTLKKAGYLRKLTQSYINQRNLEMAAITADKMLGVIRQTSLLSVEEKTEYFKVLVQSCSAFYFNFEAEKVGACVKELRKLLLTESDLLQQIDFYYSVCLEFLLKYRWFQLPEEAVTHCRYYTHLSLQTGNNLTIAMAKTVSGFVHLLREEIPESRQLFKEAIDILGEKNYGFLLICYTYMTIGYRMQNNISMTELWTNLTIEKAGKSGNKLYLSVAYANLAWVFAKRGNWLYAEDYSRKSLDLFLVPSPFYYLAIFPLVEALFLKGLTEEAQQYIFLSLHPKSKKLPSRLIELMKESVAAWINDDLEKARVLQKSIISEAKTTGYY